MGQGILALDLAKRVGWAYAPVTAIRAWPTTRLEWPDRAVSDQIISGVIDLPADHGNGQLFSVFADWLADAITDYEPGIVLYEGPAISPRIQPHQLRRALGLMGLTERVCWMREVKCREAAPSTLKKTWTGSGRAKKPDMVAEAERRGFTVADDNEADALAALDHAVLTICPPAPARAAA